MNKRKLLNSELNRLSPQEFKEADKLRITLVLDNVRSAHNIGSAFRTSDAFCIEKIMLCGISSTPPSAEIHKTALGAEDSMSWEYFEKTEDAISVLHAENYRTIAIEQAENSIVLNNFIPDRNLKHALVFGNEVKGVQQNIVDMCQDCIEIPQFGTKHSLNVSVSIGIVLWHFRFANSQVPNFF
ncbi:MAG: RNA methyltransferase [Prevotellaceae bacterium]|jgi:tRNA G18 (ribose-2'-O)-methylase SpoU|nr:RNA methyltransferase [Prevotellaceae bacterium]